MRKLPLLWILILALAPLGRAADIVDRIVATVNGHVILQSDWDDAIRLRRSSRAVPSTSSATRYRIARSTV